MKLITKFELKTKTKSELRALYRSVFDELVKSDCDTPQRRNALASLENISLEIADRDGP